jgi:two-component system sensor histidine kinase UhpB
MKKLNQFFQFIIEAPGKKPKQLVSIFSTFLLLTLTLLFISYDVFRSYALSNEAGLILYLYLILISALFFGVLYYLIKNIAYSQLAMERQEFQVKTKSYGVNMYNHINESAVLFNSIHDQKPVEEELALSEAQLKEALERYNFISKATSDTIWDWDIPNNTIVYNGGIHKMFGYAPQQVEEVRTWWMNNIHPQDIYHVNQMLKMAFMRGEQNVELMYRYMCADGSYKYIFDRAFIVYNNEGKPVRMIGSMQDETRRYEEENRIAKAIIQAQEKERQQLGMELHDNVNQILSAANLHLGIVTSKNDANEDTLKSVHTVKKYITEAIDEIRRLSHQLAPASDADVSLSDLIRTLVRSINIDGHYKINYKADFCDTDIISKDIRVGLYRILQEQLNNIVKHAKATCIDIELTQENNLLRLQIKDDGIGFDAATTSTGIGFENIKRRVKFLNGLVQINSQPQKGCELRATVPVIG